jgi:hypothetical protein
MRTARRGYLLLTAVLLALIVTALWWEVDDSAKESWRDNWLGMTALVAGLADGGRRELCTDGLIDYFKDHPEFAPEWFRVACAPLVRGEDPHKVRRFPDDDQLVL